MMKKIISILIVALSLNANAQTVGFNYGQLYSFVANQYGSQKELPKDLIRLINDRVPSQYLENARFSGTMSNYMNLHELGYGEHKEVWDQWTMLQNRLNVKQKLDLLVLALRGDMKGVVKMFSSFVPQSYVYNFVNTTKQLGIKNVEFTFNSHSPYRGLCNLAQSLQSLNYVYQNTNLTHVELENETFFATYIVGTANSNEKKSRETIQPFYDYLERTVVPSIYQVIPKSIPIGLSIARNDNAKFRAYNKIVKETTDKLIAQGYSVYLAPHFYFSGTDEKTIRKEIKDVIDIFGNGYRYRMTEFNLDSDKFKKKLSQIETIEFVERVRKVASEFNIDAVYYHTIYTQRGTHYSFVK